MDDKGEGAYAYLEFNIGEGRTFPTDRKFLDRLLSALHDFNRAAGGRGFLSPTGEGGKATVSGQIRAGDDSLQIVLQEIE